MKQRNRAEPMTTQEATLAFSLAVVLLVGMSPVAAPLGIAGVALIQVAAFALPPIGIAWRAAGSATLGLRMLGISRPRGRVVVGALLIGSSFWYLNLITMVRASDWLFDGAEELDQLGRLMFSGGEATWIVIAVVALAPAICEELLLRGAVARAVQARRGTVAAIAISAIVFGLLHLSLVRLLPTTIFGVVLAYSALASGSLVASMTIHLLNNAIAVGLASGEFPRAVAMLSEHPVAVAAMACTVCAIGLYLVRTEPVEQTVDT